MVKGIGVDIVEIDRIKLNDAFVHKILSVEEINIYNQLHTEKRKKEYLAGRFACKEAIIKALSNTDISFKDISVLNDKNGKPFTNIDNILISISHENKYVVAFATQI